MALNPLISFIVVAIIDILYFKDKILELISSSKKKSSGNKKKDTKKKNEKKVKQPDKAIYEYKVGDEIVSTGDGKMKKKTNQKETKPQKEKKKKKSGWRISQWFLLFCCFCFIAGVIAVIAFCSYIVKNAPEFKPEALYSSEPSKVYGLDNKLIATLGTENRDIITYSELPEVFINALIVLSLL